MRAEMTVLRCAMAANRLPTGHGRACGPAREAAPRPYTGYAGIPDRAPAHHGSVVHPPPCRGQAVPDPPALQGRQSPGGAMGAVVGRSARWSMHATGVCRAGGAAGEAAPRPYRVGRRIGGATDTGHGSVPRVMCRGQAVPDPPAREGRQSPGGAMGMVPGGWAAWSMHATGVCRAVNAAGEAAPRPYIPWWRVTGATCACDGGGSLPVL